MTRNPFRLGFVVLLLAVAAGVTVRAARPGRVVAVATVGGRTVVVREAAELRLPPVPNSPVGFDCNNAFYWDGGTLHCFASHEHPYRSSGRDVFHLESPPKPVTFEGDAGPDVGGRWIEAVHRADDGRLFMWYHNEPKGRVPGNPGLTVPRVGQMVSTDGGLHWADQGFVLEAPAGSENPETRNRFFAGGHGDFSVVADRANEYLYFLFSTYGRDVRDQGVAAARLRVADLGAPSGKAVKWYAGRWSEPGLGGKATPVFPADADWHAVDARAFWGPSVHWNRALKAYVVLLNRSKDAWWGQDGVYVSVNETLDDPSAWAAPQKLLSTTEWYPQVVGTDADRHDTDREAGRTARLFVKGASTWSLEFR